MCESGIMSVRGAEVVSQVTEWKNLTVEDSGLNPVI